VTRTVVLAAILAAACGRERPPGGAIALIVSSQAGDRLAERKVEAFGPVGEKPPGAFVTVDATALDQRIDGFGASFGEAGMVSLNSLPDEAARAKVLRALFDRETGAGFSLMKTVIGGTDFQSATQDWYTYDDVPGDTALEHFSIARDLGPAGLVTYIKAARAAGGDFRLQAPMDYPPDWMLVDATDYEKGQTVAPASYDLLSRYYLAYVRAYEAQGITIDFLTPFNEPSGGYTKIGYQEYWDIVRDHLGPLFEREQVATKLAPGEFGARAHAEAFLPALLDDPEARKHVAVATYHGYEGGFDGTAPTHFDSIARLHARYPDVPLWLTELCCQYGRPNLTFAEGVPWAHLIFGDLEAGASGWIYWQMILDENGGPWLVSPIHGDFDGNAQNAVVQIDRTTHEVTYTGLYWFLAHFSRFVRPGAHRVSALLEQVEEGADVRALAFRNEDGTVVLELLNGSAEDRKMQVRAGPRALDLSLPAVSISTLTWR
jgi:glucosylceramidase